MPALLAACHTNSLALARREGIRTIAFPAISTGVYGYPVELAEEVALGAVIADLEAHPGTLDEVQFVLFDAATLAVFTRTLAALRPDQPR